MDQAPVAHGRILFAKSDDDMAPVETPIVDGAFALNLAPGTKKVLIYVYNAKKVPGTEKTVANPTNNLAPARYNKQTQLSAEIDPSGSNELAFDLLSK